MQITGSLAVFGVAIVALAVAYGISKLAVAALEGIARQPEAAAKLQVSMLIAAALIEGIGLFSAVVCLLGK